MGTLLAYSIQSSVCLTLFYVFYKALLSRDTFHHFNRILLLSMIGLAIGIPVATYFIPLTSPAYPFPIAAELGGTRVIPADVPDHDPASQNNLLVYVLIIYIAGICFCLLRNIAGIAHILWIIRKGKQFAYANHVKLIVHTDNRILPFSWMKYIVISQSDMDEAGETILLHEQAHIHHRHTLDLLLAELCVLLQWYNPGAWLLYRELQAIHEYEADEAVIRQGVEAKQYQLLLIKKAVGSRLYSMANSFNHSNLKKRITMMLQKKSSSWARVKYVYILPLTAMAVVALAHPEISQPFEEISSVKVSDFITRIDPATVENVQKEMRMPVQAKSLPDASVQPIEMTNEVSRITAEPAHAESDRNHAPQPVETTREAVQAVPNDTTIFMVVEVMPEFPGGQSALMDFIAKNIVYPEKMQKNGIQGRITVSFVVARDGSIRNPEIVRGLCPEGDAEAIRVVMAMPNWIPGKQRGKAVNVLFTIPVSFRLQP